MTLRDLPCQSSATCRLASDAIGTATAQLPPGCQACRQPLESLTTYLYSTFCLQHQTCHCLLYLAFVLIQCSLHTALRQVESSFAGTTISLAVINYFREGVRHGTYVALYNLTQQEEGFQLPTSLHHSTSAEDFCRDSTDQAPRPPHSSSETARIGLSRVL